MELGMSHEAATPLNRVRVTRRAVIAALTAWALALVWFVTLSGWLGVRPHSVLLVRQNVLFNSDTNTWVDVMVHEQAPSASARVIHPLDARLWRAPALALRYALQLVVPPEYAAVLATQLLVAFVAAIGVGALACLAVTLGLTSSQCVCLFGVYLLFTSSSTIALPEYFGISNGLLTIAFVVPILVSDRRISVTVLAALVPLCAGTTLTNAAYPIAALYQWGLRSTMLRRAVLVAALLMVPIAVFLFIDSRKVVLLYTDADKDIASRVAVVPRYVPGATRWYLKTTKIHGHVADYLNLRLFEHPLDAADYALFAIAAPAVGPTPAVRTTKGADMITYESGQPLHWNPNGFFVGADVSHVRQYLGVQALGGVLWLSLLAMCLYRALRHPDTRRLVWLPAGWVVFNLLFHNVWGDELFLYAPHWSWALMALVILGARELPVRAIAAFVLPIAGCQIYTLIAIRHAVAGVVR
jgi:hypothetical protein